VSAMIINIDRKNRSINSRSRPRITPKRARRCRASSGDRGHHHRHDQPRGAAAAPRWTTRPRVADPVMTKSELIDRWRRSFAAGCKTPSSPSRWSSTPWPKAWRRRAHRDPRVRQLRPQLPARADRRNPKSGERVQVRRSTCRTSRRQGIARAVDFKKTRERERLPSPAAARTSPARGEAGVRRRG